MKNKYIITQGLRPIWLFALLLVISSISSAMAQVSTFNQDAVQDGVIRIKVTEAYSRQLERSTISRLPSNVVQTGVQPLDQLHQQFSVTEMKRVFPHAGKFEAKHRKHGLHLWYEVEMNSGASLQSAVSSYNALAEVVVSEPIYKKRLIGADGLEDNIKIIGQKDIKEQELSINLQQTASPFNDPMIADQWHYDNQGQTNGTAGADISLFEAWGIETGNSDIIVAITDGGVQTDHPDLMENLWVNQGEIPGNGIDDDGNGYVDDVHGFNFIDNNAYISPHFHGTHVAGTVGATNNNNLGVAGVAGGSGNGDGIRMMTCAVFKGDFPEGNEGSGGFEHTYIYAADNGAVISQNSWGYTYPMYYEQIVLDAIDYFIEEAGTDEYGNQTGPMKGGIVIFAAGNSNSNAAYYPGYIDQVLSVAATGHDDARSSFSNYGTWIDISAPGGDGERGSITDLKGVTSTWINGDYASISGTSMACPHVAGLAGLLVSKFGGTGYTPEMLRRKLLESTDNIDQFNSGYIGMLGAGRINALKALQSADHTTLNAITDISVTKVGSNFLDLSWTVPNDPDSLASAYDIRYSTAPITSENFDQASPAPWKGEVIPKPAGSIDSFKLKGLETETLYFVAVKMLDYNGNASSISNIIEQKTNPAPAVAISADFLEATLVTAQTTTETLIISNSGPGPLEFEVADTTTPSFGTLLPSKGTVLSGESMVLTVTFDASGLVGGLYEQEIQIITNDPAKEVVTLTLSLEVSSNEAPIAQLESEMLDFGSVIIGATAHQELKIHNAGTGLLFIREAAVEGESFSINWGETLQVDPFKTITIPVLYSPTSLGTDSGVLTLETNDTENPVLDIQLNGTSVPAPAIELDLDSIYVELKSNEIAQQSLEIRNTGGSDLLYDIQTAAPQSKAPLFKQIEIASDMGSIAAFADKELFIHQDKGPALASSESGTYTIKSMGSAIVPLKALIISPDPDNSAFAELLNAYDDLEVDVYPQSSLSGISLEAISSYPVVIVTNNAQWLAVGGVSNEKIGNILADYVDGGGKVIISGAAYTNPNQALFGLSGRFMTENYGAFKSATSYSPYAHATMGEKLVPEHPVLAGVDSIFYDGYLIPVEKADDAIALVEWEAEYVGSMLMAAANLNSVCINIFPTTGNPGASLNELWAGDVATLYHNAIRWLAPAPYVKAVPQKGLIAAGESKIVTIELDATGLDSGKFEAALALHHNIPGKAPVFVPLTMEVDGPEFTITPDSIAITLENPEKVTQTLVLKNTGTGTYDYSIQQQNSYISTGPLNQTSDSAVLEARPAMSRNMEGDVISLDDIIKRYALDEELSATELSPGSYKTDFEDFVDGSIHYQKQWVAASDGDLDTWIIDTVGNFASSGSKYVHKVSGPAVWSNLYSPLVMPGNAEKSTTSMNLQLQGEGATWEIVYNVASIFASPVTILQIRPDGSMHAFVREGNQYKSIAIGENKPNGPFKLDLELDRASHIYTFYINDRKVFSGLAMGTGNVERVVFGSGAETTDMHLYIDDLEIREGPKEEIPEYLTFTPMEGTLAPGEETEIVLDFDGTNIGFGTYHSDLLVDVAGAQKIVVPTSITLTGPSAISLNRTVLQHTTEFKKTVEGSFEIKNSGGSPLNFSLDVLGGTVTVDSSAEQSLHKTNSTAALKAVDEKILKDAKLSKVKMTTSVDSVQVLAGDIILKENFEGTFPPADWIASSNSENNLKSAAIPNYSGSGGAATFTTGVAKGTKIDETLLSPVVNIKESSDLTLQYQANYQNYANKDFFDLDIQVNGDGKWTNVLSWNEDHGRLYGTGELVQVVLTDYLKEATSFQLRWQYTASEGDESWYAQLDNVEILQNAQPWLTVSPVSGTLPARGTADITATFDALYIEEAGEHIAGIVVNTDAANASQVGVVAELTVKTPAEVTLSHDSIYIEQYWGHLAKENMMLTNSGESRWEFYFDNNVNWIGGFPEELNTALVVEGNSTKGIFVELYTIRDPGLYHDTLYIKSVEAHYPDIKIPVTLNLLPEPPRFSVKPDTVILATVAAGETTSSNITVTNTGKSLLDFTMENLKNIPYLSFSVDGVQGILPDDSTEVMIHFDATNLVAGEYHDTLFYTTNDPMFPDYVYHPFTLTVTADPAKISINPEAIQEEVRAGEMLETPLTVFNTGGIPLGFSLTNPGIEWLSFSVPGGLVPQDSSQTVSLIIDGTNLEPGVYEDEMYIMSGDPVNYRLVVPITLTVTSDQGIESFSLIEINSGQVMATFTDSLAIDAAEKDFLTYGIVANTSTTVGSVSFSIDGGVHNLINEKPYLLSRLSLPMLAQGAHVLSAKAFSQTGGRGETMAGKEAILYMINSATVAKVAVISDRGEKLMELMDGDTIYTGSDDHDNFTLVASADKRSGSMNFYLDGMYLHTDNKIPYALTRDEDGVFQPWKVDEGSYSLKMIPYSLPYAAGIAGEPKTIAFEVMKQIDKLRDSNSPVLSVHPVPAYDELNIQVKEEISGEVELFIYNSTGKLIVRKELAGGDLSGHLIDLNSLRIPPGIYYLQIVGKEGFQQVKSFIKQ